VHGEYYHQEFLFHCGVVELGSGQCLTCVGHSVVLLISTLTKHCAYGVVTCIAHDLERKFPIGRLNDGCGYECLLEGIEGHEAFLIKVERGILCQQVGQGSGYTGEVLNESLVETNMTQETPDSLDIGRVWQLFDN